MAAARVNSSARKGLAPNVVGALWMLLSSVLVTLMIVLIKQLRDYPPGAQAFFRQLIGVLVLLPVMIRMRGAAFATKQPRLILVRVLCVTVAQILTIYSYQMLSLTESNTLSFTRGLWLVPLAILFVKEKVGLLRISATLLGFGGVLIMTSGSASAHLTFSLATLAGLAGALFMALAIVGMKLMTQNHPPIVILAWSTTLGLIMAVPLALFGWRWPTPGDLALLILMGLCSFAASATFVKSLQIGDASAMAAVDYSRLPFALVAGYLVFGEVLNWRTLTGAAVVVAATLLITVREQQLAKRRAAEAPPSDVPVL